MNYNKLYSKAIKYEASADDVSALESQLTPDELAGRSHLQHLNKLQKTPVTEPEWTRRMVLADALQDHGRDTEAEAMRNVDAPVTNHNGQWKPGVVKWRDVGFYDDMDGQDHLEALQEHGPSHVLAQIKHDNFNDGNLRGEPAHNNRDELHREGNHFLSWNPNHPYVGLQERHILPEENKEHNHFDNGKTSHMPYFAG